MFFEKLTDNDKQLITDYITNCVEVNKNEKRASLDRLLQPWENNKSSSEIISKIFKDELIISKDIEFAEGQYEIENKVHDMYRDERCRLFTEAIEKCYDSYYDLPWTDDRRENYWVVRDLLSTYCLANNAIDRGMRNFDINGKTYNVQEGAKPMRVLAKIAEGFGVGITPGPDGISDLEYFRRKHSMCLNNKTLKGKLCFSIQPLDYMTMSDNGYGWHSCMSWIDCGEYKQGTVEMMNSPCVVVGYLAGDTPFSWGWGQEWNNKKWRCLFIVDKNFIINVKGYPYHNTSLVKAAITELSKLAGWGEQEPVAYDYYHHYELYRKGENTFKINDRVVQLDFCTNAMYNDFNTNHYLVVNPNTHEDLRGTYCFSGPAECMWCGETNTSLIGSSVGEAYLACDNCFTRRYCEWCDSRIYSDEEYWTTADGYQLCEHCWDNQAVKDFTNDEYYLDDNCKTIYVSNSNEKYVGSWVEPFNVYEHNIGQYSWNQIFKIKEPRKHETEYGDIIYYICPCDVKERRYLEELDMEEEDIDRLFVE